MISKAQIQFVRLLEQKKNRVECGCFMIEGDKLVQEAMALPENGPFLVKTIYALKTWLEANPSVFERNDTEVVTVSPGELDRISLQKTPNQAIAVIGRNRGLEPVFDFSRDLLIGLDQVQDPGNVGTIIRLSDWFGLGGVIASADSADFYSPKVIQSSMGSIFRVKLVSTDLHSFIKNLPSGFPVYGTSLDGHDLYNSGIAARGMILLGNESKGLSRELSAMSAMNLRIPDFSAGPVKPESLNVAIAAGIICSEFRRRGNG